MKSWTNSDDIDHVNWSQTIWPFNSNRSPGSRNSVKIDDRNRGDGWEGVEKRKKRERQHTCWKHFFCNNVFIQHSFHTYTFLYCTKISISLDIRNRIFLSHSNAFTHPYIAIETDRWWHALHTHTNTQIHRVHIRTHRNKIYYYISFGERKLETLSFTVSCNWNIFASFHWTPLVILLYRHYLWRLMICHTFFVSQTI